VSWGWDVGGHGGKAADVRLKTKACPFAISIDPKELKSFSFVREQARQIVRRLNKGESHG
jgi:hypothetical protein